MTQNKASIAFVKNVSTTFVAQILSLVLSFANVAIVARWLGPEGKGMLALALLVSGLLGLLLNGGVSVANVYFAGSRRLDISTLIASSLTFAVLATIVGITIVGGLIATGWLEVLVPRVPIWLILLALLGFPLGLLSNYFSTILQGLQRITMVNVVNLAQSGLMLVLTILLVIIFQIGLLGAMLASLVAITASLIGMSLFLRREGGIFTMTWNPRVMRLILSFGLRGYVGNVLQFFNYRLDMLIVNHFLGPTGVGIYSVSVALAELLWHLPNAIGFAIFPKAAASQPEVMNSFTPRVFRITLGLTALGGLGLALLGRPLIQFIFSSAFIGAYVPLLALLPGVVLLGGAKVLTNDIAGRGYPHWNSVNAGLALALTVVLDLVLIPRYDVIGAALASSLAYTAIFLTAIGSYRVVSRWTTSKPLTANSTNYRETR